MINIAGLTPVDDPSYRYKMPRLVPKVEGRGNGIKTVIVNVCDIGTSLNRDASEITKFFGCELGAQTTMSIEEDRYIVNGSHNPQQLQQLMAKYIELFVLCKNCRLPETHYKIKGDTIYQKCVACGSKDPCDMTHKLSSFIIKQHKKAKSEKEAKEGKESKDKKDKKDKKKSRDEEDTKESQPEEEKSKKEKKEKKSKKKKSEEEDEVVIDENLEAEGEREAIESAIEQFRSYLSHNADAFENNSSTNQTLKQQKYIQIVEELRSTQTLSSLRPSDRYIIFFGTLFTATSIADNDVLKYKDFLQYLTNNKNKHQQRQLLAGTEWLIGVKYPTLLPRYSILLKQLYDEDIVEEDVLLEWYYDENKNEYSMNECLHTNNERVFETLKDSAKLFIKWLQEADEEGEDDEEGDDEDEEEEA